METTPRQIFAAFAEPSQGQQWFSAPSEPGTRQHELDFRVGGEELSRGRFPGGPAYEYRSRFLDIEADRRIVLTYELILDGRRISASLVTLELAPDADETRVTFTEQYVFLVLTGDGSSDIAEREGGTRLLLNGLTSVAERLAAEAPR